MIEKPNKRPENGFTLIELMIVVAIIGILASIALPAYRDYMIKARFAEVISIMHPVQTSIAECLTFQTELTSCTADAVGYPDAERTAVSATSDYITSFTIPTNATTGPSLVIVPDWEGLGDNTTGIQAYSITYTPTRANNGSISWNCTSSNQAIFKYVPPNCRTTATAG